MNNRSWLTKTSIYHYYLVSTLHCSWAQTRNELITLNGRTGETTTEISRVPLNYDNILLIRNIWSIWDLVKRELFFGLKQLHIKLRA